MFGIKTFSVFGAIAVASVFAPAANAQRVGVSVGLGVNIAPRTAAYVAPVTAYTPAYVAPVYYEMPTTYAYTPTYYPQAVYYPSTTVLSAPVVYSSPVVYAPPVYYPSPVVYSAPVYSDYYYSRPTLSFGISGIFGDHFGGDHFGGGHGRR